MSDVPFIAPLAARTPAASLTSLTPVRYRCTWKYRRFSCQGACRRFARYWNWGKHSRLAYQTCLRAEKRKYKGPKYQRMLINVFVVAVYIYGDKITYILTLGDRTVTVTESLLSEIDQSNADYMNSCMSGDAMPLSLYLFGADELPRRLH